MTDSPTYLVGVLVLSILLLIFLINWRTKLHPFLALSVTSLFAAVAAGLPLADIPENLVDGAGGTGRDDRGESDNSSDQRGTTDRD